MALIKALVLTITLIVLGGCNVLSLKDTARLNDENLYRRIPYKIEGDRRVLEIFYASGRETEEKDGELHLKPVLANSISCGTLQAKIDPGVTIGTVTPGKLKRRGKIGVQEIVQLSDEDFMRSLTTAVSNSPHQSLLVLIFGYGDDFELTATKAAYFAYRLDVNTPVLLFDWPGDQSLSPDGYKKARKLTADSGKYLGALLTRIVRQVHPSKLWVKSTSLGCQVLCDGFEYMHRQDDLSDPDTEIAQVIMVAPDVGEGEFNHRFKDEIASLTAKLTVYVSANDGVLLVSEVINHEKRLGLQKERLLNQEQYEETRDLLYLKSLSPGRISIVDVTPVNKSRFGHQYVLEAPEFFDDFYLRLFDESPHNNRRLFLVDMGGGLDYWILRKDKN